MRDEYASYRAEDFALDPRFVDWVRGNASPADVAAWGAWLREHPEREPTVREAERLVRALRFADTPDTGVDADALWSRIDRSTSAPPTAAPGRVISVGKFARRWSAVAAVVLLLVALGVWLGTDSPTVQTERAQTLAYTLPDGSRVRLNAQTELIVDQDDWSVRREVSLQGEAFFEVDPGRPFAVTTPLGTVAVLGTSFNVFSRADSFYVHCTTGRVSVSTEGSPDSLILTPGQACYRSAAGTLQRVAATEIEWLAGTYSFTDQPLSRVFAELERQFNIDISYDEAIGQLRYTGFFRTDDREQALYAVTWPMGLISTAEGRDRYVINFAED